MRPIILSVSIWMPTMVALGAAFAPGCTNSGEGVECNPETLENPCASGLSCQQPLDCSVAFCCPTVGTSADIHCQAGCGLSPVATCEDGGEAGCEPTEAGADAPSAADSQSDGANSPDAVDAPAEASVDATVDGPADAPAGS